ARRQRPPAVADERAEDERRRDHPDQEELEGVPSVVVEEPAERAQRPEADAGSQGEQPTPGLHQAGGRVRGAISVPFTGTFVVSSAPALESVFDAKHISSARSASALIRSSGSSESILTS